MKKKRFPRSRFLTSYSLFRQWEVGVSCFPNTLISWKSHLCSLSLTPKCSFIHQPTEIFHLFQFYWGNFFHPDHSLKIPVQVWYTNCIANFSKTPMWLNTIIFISLGFHLSENWLGHNGDSLSLLHSLEHLKPGDWNHPAHFQRLMMAKTEL